MTTIDRLWSDTFPEQDSLPTSVWDFALSPDGQILIIAAGNRVLVYDALHGELRKALRAHQDVVYTVDFDYQNGTFASGSADCAVIIWDHKFEPLLQYKHSESIQKIRFNPMRNLIASCTAKDFGLCVPKDRQVARTSVGGKILCCEWTRDGLYLALGLENGQVSIRDASNSKEKLVITRPAPVMSLSWSGSSHMHGSNDILVVGGQEETLSFYQLSGMQFGRDLKLGFTPHTINFFEFRGVNYLLIGGDDNKLSLYSKEGILLHTLVPLESWCLTAVARSLPSGDGLLVFAGSHGGDVMLNKVTFSSVNGIYKDRFVFSDSMTDVVVQHLTTGVKKRIKCRDYVKKVALYKNRLAVQQPDKVAIYELSSVNDPNDLRYRLKEKIYLKQKHGITDCTLLVVASMNVAICNQHKLQVFDFKGVMTKEYVLDHVIVFMKINDGPIGGEALLVGLKDGTVLRIFLDNPFRSQVLKHRASIRCLDLSPDGAKLALVDVEGKCVVYDAVTKDVIFEESDVLSVAWNSQFSDMFCYSSDGVISIKSGEFPSHRHNSNKGVAVGFAGSKIFCLSSTGIETIDVPHSETLTNYIETDLKLALRVAYLGVTQDDWKRLGAEALKALDIPVAREAFIRVRDVKLLDLLEKLSEDLRTRDKENVDTANQCSVAKVLAHQGQFHEASKLYTKSGCPDKAIELFSDLRRWDEAKAVAKESDSLDVKQLVQKQAEWAIETQDWKAASEMYCAAGEYTKAVRIIGEAGWLNELIEIARTVPESDVETLSECARFFRQHDHHQYAKETYLKMGDVQNLMRLHVELHKWEEAFLLCKQHEGSYAEEVYLPYARWLTENDRFDEAQAAFKKAGNPEECRKLLEELSQGAISEQRYEDAGYYLWLLSEEKLAELEEAGDDEELRSLTRRHVLHYRTYGQLLFAYAIIANYTEKPFREHTSCDEMVFNAAQYVLNTLGSGMRTPPGISKAATLWALGKECMRLGGYKLGRSVLKQLSRMEFQSERDISMWSTNTLSLELLKVQTMPNSDKEDLDHICYRCSAKNTLQAQSNSRQDRDQGAGDACVHCRHPFIRSFHAFDTLPLVEFVPPADMSEARAEKLLRTEPKPEESSLFDHHLCSITFTQSDVYEALELPEDVLRSLEISEVFILKWNTPSMKQQYFINVVPDVAVALCSSCNSFYNEEDLDEVTLTNGERCPFCKVRIQLD